MELSGMENVIYNPANVENALVLLKESNGEFLDAEYKIKKVMNDLQSISDSQMNKKMDIILKEIDLKASLRNSEDFMDSTLFSLERIVKRFEEYIEEGKEPIWDEIIEPLTNPSNPSPRPSQPPQQPPEPTPPQQPGYGQQPPQDNGSLVGQQPPEPTPPTPPTGPDDPNATAVGPNGELPPSPPEEMGMPDGQFGFAGQDPNRDFSSVLQQREASSQIDKNTIAIGGTIGAVGVVGAASAIIHNKNKKEEDRAQAEEASRAEEIEMSQGEVDNVHEKEPKEEIFAL